MILGAGDDETRSASPWPRVARREGDVWFTESAGDETQLPTDVVLLPSGELLGIGPGEEVLVAGYGGGHGAGGEAIDTSEAYLVAYTADGECLW